MPVERREPDGAAIAQLVDEQQRAESLEEDIGSADDTDADEFLLDNGRVEYTPEAVARLNAVLTDVASATNDMRSGIMGFAAGGDDARRTAQWLQLLMTVRRVWEVANTAIRMVDDLGEEVMPLSIHPQWTREMLQQVATWSLGHALVLRTVVLSSLTREYLRHVDVESLETWEVNVETFCAICQETIVVGEVIPSLECGHSFHSLCLKQWLEQSPTCAVCRAEISEPPRG